VNLENNNDIKVSVVIPTYNRAHYLPEALASALNQTLPVFEIIVVDDGSSDGTTQLMATYGDKVRYLVQKNQGPSAARNFAMREARGNWIAFLDSDDLWEPGKNQLQTDFIRQHPYLEFVFGNLANFNAQQQDEQPEILDPEVHRYFQTHGGDLKDFYRQLLVCNPIPTSSAFFSRAAMERTGWLDETMRYCEDYDYWLRMVPHTRVGFVDHILVRRRMHDANAIKAVVALGEGTLKAFRRQLQAAALADEFRQILTRRITGIEYNLASHLLKAGRFADALVYLNILRGKNLSEPFLFRQKVLVKYLIAKFFGGSAKA
jgi:glycosyltransferase involved in cell wall biosynthesis